MAAQQVSFRLNQLKVITEKDTKGGSEPYLWVTYFSVNGSDVTTAEPVKTFTPIFDGFRTDFPDNVADGQVMNVPPFIGFHTVQLDPEPFDFMMAGCVAALLEEDESPDKAMKAGRNAFADVMHKQLNELVKQRVLTGNRDALTDAEIDVIRKQVKSKVTSAVKDKLSLGQKLFDNQDDFLGFTFVVFSDDEIQTKTFDFPELFDGKTPEKSDNRFVLSGSLTVTAPPPPPPPDRCATQRAAVLAKNNEIKGLQLMRQSLQKQLQTASPGAKAAIVKQILQTNEKIDKAVGELGQLEAALKACETKHHSGTVGDRPVVISGKR